MLSLMLIVSLISSITRISGKSLGDSLQNGPVQPRPIHGHEPRVIHESLYQFPLSHRPGKREADRPIGLIEAVVGQNQLGRRKRTSDGIVDVRVHPGPADGEVPSKSLVVKRADDGVLAGIVIIIIVISIFVVAFSSRRRKIRRRSAVVGVVSPNLQ